MLTRIARALAPHGLILRGGFHPESDEAGLEDVGTVLLVGNAGGAMWKAFAPHIDGERNPLDRWTKRVIDPIAEKFGARAIYPFGAGRAALPALGGPRGDCLSVAARHSDPPRIRALARLSRRAAFLRAAGFAAALGSAEPLRDVRGQAMPVGLSGRRIQRDCVRRCRLARRTWPARSRSASPVGCLARNACPVGQDWRYPEAQARFHMAAFSRSVAGVAAS